MSFNPFCKEVLMPVLAGIAIGPLCCLFAEEFKKNQGRKRFIQLLRELEEALKKGFEEAKVMELNRVLEDLEKGN